jgi:hypothetical protein
MSFFDVTYTDGSVEEIEADDCQDNDVRYLTFVRYRIPFLWTVYAEIVREAGSPRRRPGGRRGLNDWPVADRHRPRRGSRRPRAIEPR